MAEQGAILEINQILEVLPHRYPFLLVDRIVAMEAGKRITGIKNVTFNEPYFQGHFPGNPITPGVILIESMAQAGVVALGLWLLRGELGADASKYTTLFTDASVDFSGIVPPGARVINTGRKQFFRRRKIRSEVEMRLEDGTLDPETWFLLASVRFQLAQLAEAREAADRALVNSRTEDQTRQAEEFLL